MPKRVLWGFLVLSCISVGDRTDQIVSVPVARFHGLGTLRVIRPQIQVVSYPSAFRIGLGSDGRLYGLNHLNQWDPIFLTSNGFAYGGFSRQFLPFETVAQLASLYRASMATASYTPEQRGVIGGFLNRSGSQTLSRGGSSSSPNSTEEVRNLKKVSVPIQFVSNGSASSCMGTFVSKERSASDSVCEFQVLTAAHCLSEGATVIHTPLTGLNVIESNAVSYRRGNSAQKFRDVGIVRFSAFCDRVPDSQIIPVASKTPSSGEVVQVNRQSGVELGRQISSETASGVYVQTEGGLVNGDSGGAILNSEGRIVGVNSASIGIRRGDGSVRRTNQSTYSSL